MTKRTLWVAGPRRLHRVAAMADESRNARRYWRERCLLDGDELIGVGPLKIKARISYRLKKAREHLPNCFGASRWHPPVVRIHVGRVDKGFAVNRSVFTEVRWRHNAHDFVRRMPVNPVKTCLDSSSEPPGCIGILAQPVFLGVKAIPRVGIDAEK